MSACDLRFFTQTPVPKSFYLKFITQTDERLQIGREADLFVIADVTQEQGQKEHKKEFKTVPEIMNQRKTLHASGLEARRCFLKVPSGLLGFLCFADYKKGHEVTTNPAAAG